MKFLFTFLLLLPFSFIFADDAPAKLEYDYQDFAPYQQTLTRDEIAKRIQLYLQKDQELADYYALTEEAFLLYASPDAKKKDSPEFTLTLAKKSHPVISSTPSSLSGIRIALDPGHIGGPLALLEERQQKGFDEGTLTLLTAKHLKKLLEAEGAQVLLTRERVGESVYPQDFFAWAKQQPQQGLPPAELFLKHYLLLDLRARADKINAFDPHLTLIIHYNAHGSSSPANYNMAFVGGSFLKGELQEKEARYHFLRFLITDDLDQSKRLGEAILRHFSTKLHVPSIPDKNPLPYLKNACLFLSEGLYARNLALTRRIKGIVCYGEPLCQNHPAEEIRLADKSIVLEGIEGPQRAIAVAEAYFAAIRDFLLPKTNIK